MACESQTTRSPASSQASPGPAPPSDRPLPETPRTKALPAPPEIAVASQHVWNKAQRTPRSSRSFQVLTRVSDSNDTKPHVMETQPYVCKCCRGTHRLPVAIPVGGGRRPPWPLLCHPLPLCHSCHEFTRSRSRFSNGLSTQTRSNHLGHLIAHRPQIKPDRSFIHASQTLSQLMANESMNAMTFASILLSLLLGGVLER